MDVIFIHDLRLDLLIGVYEWERRVPQTVQLDLEIGIPETGRPRSDRIRDTIDYAKVIERVTASLKQERFLLVERLAEHLAQLLMREFGAPWVRVSVSKLAVERDVKRVGITIERGTRK
ncbi:MAG TPA: dihydroneopterin aldolase [Burkholderiales bacterium]|nr:dihydroneopterin aldolase [Burkholderiales bacterium]